nr:hypothetical protein [Enterococcus sp. 665A]
MSKKRVFEGKVLGEEMSDDWEYFLDTAPVFNYLNMKEIHLVCPIPGEKGTFVLQDDLPYLATEGPLKMIEKFFATHRLMDYQLMRRTCQSLEGLPSKKVPIVNAHFVLFPITKPEISTWLNPLTIFQVAEDSGYTTITLTNGLSLKLPIVRKSLVALTNKAIYSLATYRQDYSTFMRSEGHPLSYVMIPATPFGRTLVKQKLLQEWLLTPGEFSRQYKLEEHLLWYQSLEGEFPEIE